MFQNRKTEQSLNFEWRISRVRKRDSVRSSRFFHKKHVPM